MSIQVQCAQCRHRCVVVVKGRAVGPTELIGTRKQSVRICALSDKPVNWDEWRECDQWEPTYTTGVNPHDTKN